MCKGNITTGVSFDIPTYEEMEKLRDVDRSKYIQIAVRHMNRRVKKRTAKEILENLDNSMLKELEKELLKRKY